MLPNLLGKLVNIMHTLIAERLSAKHLILLHSRISFVCMYVCIIYVHHGCGCDLDIRLYMLVVRGSLYTSRLCKVRGPAY